MLIAQVTDLHIGFHRDQPGDANLERFRMVLDRLKNGPDRPDMLLLTGDIAEHGDAESYAALAEVLADSPFPIWPIPGNHDNRAALAAAFPQVPQDGAFLHYVVDTGTLRIVMLDTLEEGRHGGAFCAARATWLSAELAVHPDTATIVALHHPPVALGIAWMDPNPAEPWIARLGAAMAGHGQVRALICGHVHRPIAASFAGVPLIVCPSSSAGLALDLSPIDPAKADRRAMLVDDLPGFALHRWDGRSLASHFGYAPDPPAVARYDANFQKLVIHLAEEKRQHDQRSGVV
ncbi:MAG: phosphodiesterase [Novosphingobium sp.]